MEKKGIEKRKCANCEDCGCKNTAAFFHSKCCNAHFEGVVMENQDLVIVCEKCGEFAAKIQTQTNQTDNKQKEVTNGNK